MQEEQWSSLDDLEKYSRKNSLEIEEAVLKLATMINVAITLQEIEISHKVRRKKTNSIIVKFVRHKAKTKL